jgi:hypothetical protein
MALSEEENCEPFCSSCARLLAGVEPAKKVLQLTGISVAAEEDPVPLGLAWAAVVPLGLAWAAVLPLGLA